MQNIGSRVLGLQGVRDQLRSLQRLMAHMQHPLDTNCLFLEQDMEDTFWNIPKDEAFRALKWGCGMLSKRGCGGLGVMRG